MPFLIFLPRWCLGGPRASPFEDPLASKSRNNFWNLSNEAPWEARAERVGTRGSSQSSFTPHPLVPRRNRVPDRESDRFEVKDRQDCNCSLFSCATTHGASRPLGGFSRTTTPTSSSVSQFSNSSRVPNNSFSLVPELAQTPGSRTQPHKTAPLRGSRRWGGGAGCLH